MLSASSEMPPRLHTSSHAVAAGRRSSFRPPTSLATPSHFLACSILDILQTEAPRPANRGTPIVNASQAHRF
ncbi:hypothetical protein T484DRAFT_1922857, partial [Baffinella frigidus]